jgi:hypothetical protein
MSGKTADSVIGEKWLGLNQAARKTDTKIREVFMDRRNIFVELIPKHSVWFLFVLAILSLSSVVSARDLYTAEDRMVCGDTEVRASTTCTSDSDGLVISDCLEQHFVFSNLTEKVSRKISASCRLRERYGNHGKKMGKWLDIPAFDWACLKGRDGSSYILIGYFNGGICDRCEWDEIFDLHGNRLATDEVGPQATHNEEERIIHAFNKKYRALHLPMPWPDSSFKTIRRFEKPAY